MNFTETIDYLYSRLPMFSRLGSAAYKKDLDNIRVLCDHLGNPQQSFRTIHVGGTNGKGSVSHMLAAILQTAGYKTGLYTSPHLYDFRERIRLNGIMMPKDDVVDFVDRIKPVIEHIEPSFFEITVAMAFDYFAKQKVDIAVIEVGLGGRLDSTNIIVPELAVITNIGMDHMNLLGDTLTAIAGEKAGIIKKGIPVVIGEKNKETDAVFLRTAESNQAPLYFATDRYQPLAPAWKDDILIAGVKDAVDMSVQHYFLDLTGIYQTKNICTVLQSVAVLRNRGFKITNDQVKKAVYNCKKLTGLGGRWEILRYDPLVIIDVAHNEDGIAQMVRHISFMQFRKLHIIIGIVKDKNVSTVLKLLPANASYYFTKASTERALPTEELLALAVQSGLKGISYSDVNSAVNDAISKADQDDLIVVCGSIFLVAEVDKAAISNAQGD